MFLVLHVLVCVSRPASMYFILFCFIFFPFLIFPSLCKDTVSLAHSQLVFSICCKEEKSSEGGKYRRDTTSVDDSYHDK